MNLSELNLDELIGVVSLYPWFGGARKELCRRMSSIGQEVTDSQYADAALYVASRRKIALLRRGVADTDMSDADVEVLLKKYINDVAVSSEENRPAREVFVVGGDYFSQADYEKVRNSGDNVFSRYAAKARKESVESMPSSEASGGSFYTETLAQIYADQGYYDQARDIYSKLILAYPEKNAYFAALIEKLEEINS